MFRCEKCICKYKTRSALNKHDKLKHSEQKDQVFVCNICSASCSQAHTLKEHFRDKHGTTVSIDEIGWMVQPRADEVKKKSNGPKRIRSTIKCKCGTKNSGTYVFQRHVRDMHQSLEYDNFLDSNQPTNLGNDPPVELAPSLPDENRSNSDLSAVENFERMENPVSFEIHTHNSSPPNLENEDGQSINITMERVDSLDSIESAEFLCDSGKFQEKIL